VIQQCLPVRERGRIHGVPERNIDPSLTRALLRK
jgi:hypothetical protein